MSCHGGRVLGTYVDVHSVAFTLGMLKWKSPTCITCLQAPARGKCFMLQYCAWRVGGLGSAAAHAIDYINSLKILHLATPRTSFYSKAGLGEPAAFRRDLAGCARRGCSALCWGHH